MTALDVRDLGPGMVGVTVETPDGEAYLMNTPERLAALVPAAVVEVHPTSTTAADLPLGMVYEVTQVLRAHGLDPDLLLVSDALYGVITATSVEHGGVKQ